MGLKEAIAEAKRIVKGEDEAGTRLSDPYKILQEVSSNPIQVLEPPNTTRKKQIRNGEIRF